MAKNAIPKSGPMYDGEVKGKASPGDDYAKPFEPIPSGIDMRSSIGGETLDRPGFESNTSAYITKKGTPYGEGAKFNYLPPGMEIENQEITDQRNLKLKKITNMGYEGDGWTGD